MRRRKEGNIYFQGNNARSENIFRFSLPGLSVFSEPETYLRGESSTESLGSRFLPSLSLFGVLTIEVNTLQPVACDMERELGGGICGTSGGGESIGTSDGDGAVDGRLRMGRGSFGGVWILLSGDWRAVRRVNVSFARAPLVGAVGELKARPADRGR